MRPLMEFHLPHIVVLLSLVVVASHAALTPELYWDSVLPKTPMPKALRDLLRSSVFDEDKSTYVGVGTVGVNAAKTYSKTYYAATENQLHDDDPNVAFFFLEKDLYPGKKMKLDLGENPNPSTATFLPRQVANSIPFSSTKLPEIYNQFSVKPGTFEAEIMKNIIEECEGPGIEGEEKYCATSLESMVDFATSKLGKEIQAVSTEAEKKSQKQEYPIMEGVKKISGDKAVSCHKENYVYAVFFCHATQATRVYTVPLKGAEGSEIKAVVVCHTDTSKWNPKSLPFQLLKVKPGAVPICHFLPQDHIVWVPN